MSSPQEPQIILTFKRIETHGLYLTISSISTKILSFYISFLFSTNLWGLPSPSPPSGLTLRMSVRFQLIFTAWQFWSPSRGGSNPPSSQHRLLPDLRQRRDPRLAVRQALTPSLRLPEVRRDLQTCLPSPSTCTYTLTHWCPHSTSLSMIFIIFFIIKSPDCALHNSWKESTKSLFLLFLFQSVCWESLITSCQFVVSWSLSWRDVLFLLINQRWCRDAPAQHQRRSEASQWLDRSLRSGASDLRRSPPRTPGASRGWRMTTPWEPSVRLGEPRDGEGDGCGDGDGAEDEIIPFWFISNCWIYSSFVHVILYGDSSPN